MKEKLELEVVLKVKADIQDAAGLSKGDKEDLKFVARQLAREMDTCPVASAQPLKSLRTSCAELMHCRL